MVIPKNIIKIKRGFAVLFSIMLASFLITLGISIFSISLKETMITTSVRDSQIAYYAADSARECALYWDVKMGAFPTCVSDGCSTDTFADKLNTIKCNGIDIPVNFPPKVPGVLKYTMIGNTTNTPNDIFKDFFKYSGTDIMSPRSDIRISKEWLEASQRVQTVIDTWGHNTGVLGRRVERGIRQINN